MGRWNDLRQETFLPIINCRSYEGSVQPAIGDKRDGAASKTAVVRRITVRIASRRACRAAVRAATTAPFWGARKLLRVLATRHPRVSDSPAASTVADLLARRGLVHKRPRRRPHRHPGVLPIATHEPNDLWTADFTGQFRTGNGVYCYPLTIADQHTRYLLTCHDLLSTETVTARPIFERAFREYGLPRAIRTDNGVPLATQAIHGLSYLNMWWMRLGIQHQRIHARRPQQNGAHARMHRTLKRQATRPAMRTCASQTPTASAYVIPLANCHWSWCSPIAIRSGTQARSPMPPTMRHHQARRSPLSA